MQPLERTAAAVRALQSAMTSIGPNVDAICRIAVEHAVDVLERGEGATLELLQDRRLVCRAAYGSTAGAVGMRTDLFSSLSGLCARTGASQLCRDSHDDARVDLAWSLTLDARSVIAVPLPVDGKIIGVLKIISSDINTFDEGDVALAELLVAPLAYGLAAASSHHNEQMFVSTFEQAAVGMCHVGLDGKLLRVNRRFCEIAGHPAEALIGSSFQEITHPDDLSADLSKLAELLKGEIDSYSLEKRYLTREGDPVWVNLTVSLVRDTAEKLGFFIAVVEDIRARREAQELAMYDPLTGLPNRRQLTKRLEELLVSLRSDDAPACVAFLDVDKFKTVNDAFGHAEGDRCLAAIADILKKRIRRSDMAARLAGDEFIILMPRCSEETALQALERLRSDLLQLAKEKCWPIGLSAGALMLPAGAAVDGETVLQAADARMYDAKRERTGSAITMGWIDRSAACSTDVAQ